MESREQGEGAWYSFATTYQYFWSFTRCLRRAFRLLYATLRHKQHTVIFVVMLQRLRRFWFTHLGPKND